MTSVGIGMPNLAVALVPGHVGTKTSGQLRNDILDVTLDEVVSNLTMRPAAQSETAEPQPRAIVVKGGFMRTPIVPYSLMTYRGVSSTPAG